MVLDGNATQFYSKKLFFVFVFVYFFLLYSMRF